MTNKKLNVKNDGKRITEPNFLAGILSNGMKSTFLLNGEHNRKWIAKNPNNLIGIELKIDNGLIHSTSSRKCDNGLLLQDNRFYLVEFKGKKYKEATEQLIATKTYFTTEEPYRNYCFTFYARGVCSSVPKAKTDLQKVKVELKKSGFCDILFKENITESV